MKTIMFQPRFIEPILSGQKYRTIRPERKRAIEPGDELSLRVWEGKPYRSRQRLLMNVICVGVFDILVDDCGVQIGNSPWTLEEHKLNDFATRDGFDCWKSMREFFEKQYGFPKAAKLIEWVEPRPPDNTLMNVLLQEDLAEVAR